MRIARMMLCTALLSCAGSAAASEPALDWLAGRWCNAEGNAKVEEFWLPEAGGELIGMSRTLRGGQMKSFEFMRIKSQDKTASFHVQPNGRPPTVFTQAARGDGWIRFENEAHDFPKRIEYRRDGERLHASIAGPGRDGKERTIPFEYRRCRD